VIWNLLSNAVKFTPRGGQVRIMTASTPAFVEIVVSDTGSGLSREFLPFAFDRFRQADQSFTRSHGGLGLGLAIVKHVVELHGGEVAAESDGPGSGAVFRVRLPAYAGAGELDGEEERWVAAAQADGPDFGGRLILVVDDDAATRELMVAMLTKVGAMVRTASSAREAFTQLDVELPALIVADIGMPEEDGLSFSRRLRCRPPDRGGNVPTVALSAYARLEDRQAALSAGFDAFVAKPALPSELLATIQQTLVEAGTMD
jgi:CheY-like chemotaxis protein